MSQPVRPTESQQHLFSDIEYGETPQLTLPGASPAASNAARLIVKFGVDGCRAPEADAVKLADAAARLQAMRQAAAFAGFMVDLRLAKVDGTGTVRAHYTHTTKDVGLIMADRPSGTSGRMFSLQWVVGADGLYEPRVPTHASSDQTAYLAACAQAYDELWSFVMGTGEDPALEVVRARLTPYVRPPLQPAEYTGAVIPEV